MDEEKVQEHLDLSEDDRVLLDYEANPMDDEAAGEAKLLRRQIRVLQVATTQAAENKKAIQKTLPLQKKPDRADRALLEQIQSKARWLFDSRLLVASAKAIRFLMSYS